MAYLSSRFSKNKLDDKKEPAVAWNWCWIELAQQMSGLRSTCSSAFDLIVKVWLDLARDSHLPRHDKSEQITQF